MRKLIWSAMAFSVAAAVGMYCASNYAAHHPESMFTKTWMRVASFSPVGMWTGCKAPAADKPCCAPSGCLTMVKPTAGGEEASEPSDLQEPIRIELAPACPPSLENLLFGPQTEEPKVGEADGLPQHPAEQPGTMPYAPEDMELPKAEVEEFGVEIGLTLPTGDYLKHEPQYILQSPPFPLPREQAELEKAAAQQQGGSEESEPALPGKEGVPNMQEDPAYHHHYDGCPYLGACPRPYYPAPLTPLFPIEKPVVKPVKKKPVPATAPATPDQPQSIPHQSRRMQYEEESTSPVRVDTMDYRPRDDGPALPSGHQPF